MNGRNRGLSWAQTAALVVGLPALLVVGEILRSYAAGGSGSIFAWAQQDLSAFAGAYAYLFFATALTATLVGGLVKRSALKALRRARRESLAQTEGAQVERSQGRVRVQVATPLQVPERVRESA